MFVATLINVCIYVAHLLTMINRLNRLVFTIVLELCVQVQKVVRDWWILY